MKKFLTLMLTVLSIGFVASAAEAKTAATENAVTVAAESQINIRLGNRRRRQVVRRRVVRRPVVRRRVITTRRVTPNGRRVVRRRVITRRVTSSRRP